MDRVYTCILCPNGCEMAVRYEGKQLQSCEGNLCPKGEEYAAQEIANPMRTIASSVPVAGGELPLASVRLTKPIPRERIFDLMEEIRKLRLEAPVKAGTVLLRNPLGFETELIVTRNVAKL